MTKKVDIRETGAMTAAHGDRLEKLLLVIAGQTGMILAALGKTLPPGEDQERMKQAAIEMTQELAQIYNFEFNGPQ